MIDIQKYLAIDAKRGAFVSLIRILKREDKILGKKFMALHRDILTVLWR